MKLNPTEWLMIGALAMVPGCVVEHHRTPAASEGYLTVHWSIGNVQDPRDCRAFGVDAIDVFVTYASGAVVGDFYEYCDVFVTSISLAPGAYDASAVLVDAADYALTTSVDLGRFRVYGRDEVVIPTDFPIDSFY